MAHSHSLHYPREPRGRKGHAENCRAVGRDLRACAGAGGMSVLVSILVAGALSQVQLRGGEAAPAGDVIGVDAPGVVLGPPPGTLVIGWDRVREVGGSWKEKASPFMAGAEQAWRARSRLER